MNVNLGFKFFLLDKIKKFLILFKENEINEFYFGKNFKLSSSWK